MIQNNSMGLQFLERKKTTNAHKLRLIIAKVFEITVGNSQSTNDRNKTNLTLQRLMLHTGTDSKSY